MQAAEKELPSARDLRQRYTEVRGRTEALCRPLAVDDYQVQSIPEVSPPKWHIAHVSWFFETFLLKPYLPDYPVFSERFAFLFNSYYEGIGPFHPRPQRAVLSRPTVDEVYRYRAHVDQWMRVLLDAPPEAQAQEIEFRTSLGLHHEQQHQELLVMDIKRNFFANPLRPAYLEHNAEHAALSPHLDWHEYPAGLREMGHGGTGFAYDNESPRHRTYLDAYRLASRLTTNGEYLEFVEAGGYRDARHWLADGWRTVREQQWSAPLYWERIDGAWLQMTLAGMRPLALGEPVCHISHYEADAYARWRGLRLPTEAELEAAVADLPVQGNFMESGRLHPVPGEGQWFGDLWEWTASAYLPYSGFRPLPGELAEYNGKFMANQMVLRGGCCATPQSHMRATYRNFFYPHDRWQFSGIRLAA